MTGRFISYLRVSTGKQARSGLGIEAQRTAVRSYLNGGDNELLDEYVEAESGKRDDRPKLRKALKHCKVTGATLIIAKLDRLSRNARFLLELQDSRVNFICADMPEANEMTIQIMAVMAQQERKMISQRTKAALAAAKERGVKLGNPHGAIYIKDHGNAEAVEQIKRDAQNRAEDLSDVVEDIRNNGITSIRGITNELTARGINTPRGGKWHPTSVARLLKRLA
nr:recombinase family protein [Pseudodesulfovibrio sp.]